MRLLLAKKRLENLPESATTTKDSRLHRADAAFEDFRNLVVAQSLEVAQDNSGAKHFRNFLQSMMHGNLNLSRSQLLKGCCPQIFDFDRGMAFFEFGVNRNILLQMALEPAFVIERLANGDAVNPGFQRAALAELANPPEGFQENFLRTVGRVGGIAEHAQNQVIDRGVVVGDQPVKCRFRAGLQLRDEFGFIAAPRKGADPFGHCRPFRPGCWLARTTLLLGPRQNATLERWTQAFLRVRSPSC